MNFFNITIMYIIIQYLCKQFLYYMFLIALCIYIEIGLNSIFLELQFYYFIIEIIVLFHYLLIEFTVQLFIVKSLAKKHIR